MKTFLLPIAAIASCASIAFIAGTKLGMTQTNLPTSERRSTPDAETIPVQQPLKSESEATCEQSDREACNPIEMTKDLIEFQARMQRITDRAKDEITRLRAESDGSIEEMQPEEPQLLNQEVQPDPEITVRPQTVQKALLQQVVTSSLQPITSMNWQPIESMQNNNEVAKNQSTLMIDESASVVEPSEQSNAETP